MGQNRPYTYYDFSISLCSECLQRVPAKIVFQDDQVFMRKTCDEHGKETVLISSDVDYYKRARNYVKKSEMPEQFNTPVEYGCPYDCGLCTDHEQHSCVTLLEVTDRCNLTCPTCYAMSSPSHGSHRSMEKIRFMLDRIVENEGEPDVVQLSGGEPTIHPRFFDILDEARKRPIKHLMVNTNGQRIAEDREFAERLASYAPGFEIYLQFDSFRPDVLQTLRGEDLTATRERVMDTLNELGLSTTLVVTVQNGLNDDEIGEIIEYALDQSCVRGVTFQPTQVAGRVKGFDPKTDRITLAGVRNEILEQTDLFNGDDLVPVPCNPDALFMGYALKLDGDVYPLTRYVNLDDLLEGPENTIVYEQTDLVQDQMMDLFSTSAAPEGAADDLHELLCCLPNVSAPELSYDNLFRVIGMRFIDAFDFDVRTIKKSCVHIVHEDGRMIPFETMNLFYRDEHQEKLKELQSQSSW